MNETIDRNAAPQGPSLTHDPRVRVPDTSMLPGAEKARPVAVASLNRVVDAAHDAVDRFADSAAPKVRQLGRTRDEWVEGLRGAVRTRPLAALAAAAALGAVIVRITRRPS